MPIWNTGQTSRMRRAAQAWLNGEPSYSSRRSAWASTCTQTKLLLGITRARPRATPAEMVCSPPSGTSTSGRGRPESIASTTSAMAATICSGPRCTRPIGLMVCTPYCMAGSLPNS